MSLYKETLMKHFRNPTHKIERVEALTIQDGINPSCGDNITIFLDSKNSIIEELSFTGNGCAISMASADILCDVIKGKQNPKKVVDDFLNMINGEDISFSGDLEVLDVFKEMQNFPARRSCAVLPWNTLKQALEISEAV